MWNDWRDFKPSRPREAKGGIKARSRRGAFGESWWAQRWIEALEWLDTDDRLPRGRGYARSGQVLSIDVEKGLVKARVQGSQLRPYAVTIELAPLTPAQWSTMLQALSTKAVFAAKLAAGEMPEEIEAIFAQAGLSLFPTKHGDLVTGCSCRDRSNPCKHVAAVYYLLAEEFDRDPFLLFRLRGMTRDRLIARLGGKRAGTSRRSTSALPAPAEPLPSDPETFWGSGVFAGSSTGEIQPPPVPAALLRQLGGFPFWRGARPIDEDLRPVYDAVSRWTLRTLMPEEERRGSKR